MSGELDGLDWVEAPGGGVVPKGQPVPVLPNPEQVRALEGRLLHEGPKCPAARMGRFADSGRAYVHCGVERKAFAVADSPVAAIKWCAGDYAGADGGQIGGCPLWEAAQTGDPKLHETYAAQAKAAADAQTSQQIGKGIRVDDRGLDPDLPSGTREIIEEIERSAE